MILVKFWLEQVSTVYCLGGGGAGPGGVKAVAPTGLVLIEVNIPSQVDSVAILGEILEVRRLDGHDIFTSTGRPIAIISNVEVSYLAR